MLKYLHSQMALSQGGVSGGVYGRSHMIGVESK